jgi:hypothetical protein
MRNFLVALLLVMNFGSSALAQGASPPDTSQFQAIISGQLEAFKADNGSVAYSFAAPMVQQIFPNVESFMAMVQRGYAPVYHNNGYEFGIVTQDALGRPVQQVKITGLDGEHYVAAYSMQQQPDGSWKIAGCTLMKIQGIGV